MLFFDVKYYFIKHKTSVSITATEVSIILLSSFNEIGIQFM